MPRKKKELEMANIYVEAQRETDPDYVSAPPFDVHNFIFVHYEYTITASDAANGFEWWFPRSNGDARHSVVRNATLFHEKQIIGPGADLSLFLQSPAGDIRVLMHKFAKAPGCERVPEEFYTPHDSRGILVVTGGQAGDILKACYLVERI